MPEIMITRAGMITSAGVGSAAVLAAMDAGRPVFGDHGPGGRPWPTAAMSPDDIRWPSGSFWANARKYATTATHAAVAAATGAMTGSAPSEGEAAERSGVVMAVGSGADELGDTMARIAVTAQTDPRPLPKLLYDEVPDFSYIRGIPSQIGQFVTIATGFRGSNVAVYGEGGAAGLGALAQALRLLRSGELDRVMVVGVTPPLSTGMLVAYDREDPLGTRAVPGAGPFDAGRAGTFPGQGAVAILLERRGAAGIFGPGVPLARLVSCGTLCAPSRRAALAGATAAALGGRTDPPVLWWAHGAGSVVLDADECAAAGPFARRAATTSSKGTIGNSFESAALVDVVLAASSLRRGLVPPVGLLTRPDPALGDVDFVTAEPRPVPGAGLALVTSVTRGAAASTAGAAVLEGAGSDE